RPGANADKKRVASSGLTRAARMEPTQDMTPPSHPGAAPAGELVVQGGRLTGTRRPLRVPLTLLGRAPGCDVRLNVEGVDPLHCAVVHGADGVLVRDLDSRQGTFVNGERVSCGLLRDGDLLALGPFQFRVCLPAAPAVGASDPREPTRAAAEKEALRVQAAA